jgi:hypothetical protein
MLRVLVSTFGLFFAVLGNTVEVDFGEPIEAELKISSVTMNNSGMAATYEGNVGKYGMVIASHNYLPSNDTETKGSFTGSVQAINDAGNVDRSATAGIWSRTGTKMRIYGYDDDDLSRIMWVGDADLKAKTLSVKVWELDQQ